jgi:hypothetical protein
MSALNLLNVSPECNTCTIFLMLTDELFLGFETLCSTLTWLWYGQEELGYRTLHNKYLWSRHFSESDFTISERVHLDRLVVACGSDSISRSLLQPLEVLRKSRRLHFCLVTKFWKSAENSYWINHVSIIMFHKLEKVTVVTRNCSAAAETCFRPKPLVLSTLSITSSPSTIRDYIQETDSELELQLFPALQTCVFKKKRGEAKVTLPQAYCISLPRDTALWKSIVFTRVLFRLCVSFCLRWMAKSSKVSAGFQVLTGL